MPIEQGIPIPFRSEGVRFSHVPRDRATERSAAPIDNGKHFFEAMDREQALTAYYVILTNRSGASPDSGFRSIRDVFESQQTIVATFPLNGPEGAVFDLMGSTTAPYAADDGETHFLCFVTRNGNVPTFGELSNEEIIKFHKILGHTLDYLHANGPAGSKSYIGFSFSPLESRRTADVFDPSTGNVETILFPRSPVQNIATIHGHLVTMQPERLTTYSKSDKRFDERMTHEPKLEALAEIFRTLILEPVMRDFHDLSIKYSEYVTKGDFFPKGSFLTIDRDTLKSPRFAQCIHALHQQAERMYFRIADSLVIAEGMFKGEVVMRPREEIRDNFTQLFGEYPFRYLSDETKRFIRLFGRMKDPNSMVTPQMPFGERAKIAESFVLLGLSYNIVYYYPEGATDKAIVAIEPRWISGASPTETMGIFKDQEQVPTAEFQPIRERNMDSARKLGIYLEEHIS